MFLKFSQNSQKNSPGPSLFFNKVADLQACDFIKKRLQLSEFYEISKETTPQWILQNFSEQLRETASDRHAAIRALQQNSVLMPLWKANNKQYFFKKNVISWQAETISKSKAIREILPAIAVKTRVFYSSFLVHFVSWENVSLVRLEYMFSNVYICLVIP